MSKEIAIKIEGLSKKYWLKNAVTTEDGGATNELWALKDLNLDVYKGESIGIIGPNGSGKSTLLKILSGITKPTSGRIEISGKVASILDVGSGFHPELSGRENVFMNGQLLGHSKKEIKAKFDEIVDFSGIEKFIDEPIKNYSAGMYLRLAFSIMIQTEADIYLFDEVLSVGDEDFRKKCDNKLKEKLQTGYTSIAVSHEFLLLSSFVSKILSFPDLKEISIPKLFNSQKIENGDLSENVGLIDIHHLSENGFHKISVILDSSLNPEEIDIVLLFTPEYNRATGFAVSSLHPAKINFTDPQEKNKLHFETSIPTHLINPNTYIVSVQIVSRKNIVIRQFKDCLKINVEMEENPGDKFYNFYPGPIRLKVDWNIS